MMASIRPSRYLNAGRLGSSYFRESKSSAAATWGSPPRWPNIFEQKRLFKSASAKHLHPSQDFRPVLGKDLKLKYGRNLQECEHIARAFLDKADFALEHEWAPVVGFDMQWFYDPFEREQSAGRPQDEVSMIALADRGTVGLFHIGLLPGQEPEELVAPSLRKIIESPHIKKVGLDVLPDFDRLRRHLHLEPRAAFELHHLHRLVKFGRNVYMEKWVNTDITGCTLPVLLEEHLKKRLKSNEQGGNWSQKLTQGQIKYAQEAVYAIYTLYRKLNKKRLNMFLAPPPPLPKLADEYLATGEVEPRGRGSLKMLLEPIERGDPRGYITATEYFRRARRSGPRR